MADVTGVLADLAAESEDVDRLVTDLPAALWALPTPAPGWTIAHQIAHLAWTDNASTLAVNDPDAFASRMTALADRVTLADRGAEQYLDEPSALLARWRRGRRELADALRGVSAGQRIPWFGPAMSPVSMATARIMETWAHGLDIADTLAVDRTPTTRLRHIAFLGHRTMAYAFLAHGRPAPTVPVYVALSAPDRSQWTFGPDEAADRVTGPALDFCLLVTQRRHRADLALHAEGPVADEWLDIAQAFAGPPGPGRQPTGRAR